jgi:hypothetical protein
MVRSSLTINGAPNIPLGDPVAESFPTVASPSGTLFLQRHRRNQRAILRAPNDQSDQL